jgi:diphthamide biosynthesis methyltransferase
MLHIVGLGMKRLNAPTEEGAKQVRAGEFLLVQVYDSIQHRGELRRLIPANTVPPKSVFSGRLPMKGGKG